MTVSNTDATAPVSSGVLAMVLAEASVTYLPGCHCHIAYSPPLEGDKPLGARRYRASDPAPETRARERLSAASRQLYLLLRSAVGSHVGSVRARL